MLLLNLLPNGFILISGLSPESGGGLAGRRSAGTKCGFAGEQGVKFPGWSAFRPAAKAIRSRTT